MKNRHCRSEPSQNSSGNPNKAAPHNPGAEANCCPTLVTIEISPLCQPMIAP